MTLTKELESRIRGWFPEETTLIAIQSKSLKKTSNFGAIPVSALGATMIVASLLSAAFGTTFVSIYLSLNTGIIHTIYLTGLLMGIICLVAFAAGLASGIVLLTGKYTAVAVAGMIVLMFCGLATVLIPLIEGWSIAIGLIFALPMFASSIIALTVTCFEKAKLTTPRRLPSAGERIFAGLASAGGGLTAIGTVFYLLPINPNQLVVTASLTIGVPLLVAAFLVRRTPKILVNLQ
jgi:hypothetical protein